jgi:hypothetical protein
MQTQSSVKSFVRTHLPTGLVNALRKVRYRRTPIKEIFTDLYYEPVRDQEMISGPGSDREQTAVIAREIPKLLAELQVRSMLDAPCGDFYWMRHVTLPVTRYVGVDIVDDLITRHRAAFANEKREFHCLDLSEDPLPQTELTCDVHCVTGWTMLDAKFTGVKVSELAKKARVLSSARHVIFEAANGYTSNVRLAEATAPSVIIAHKHNGQPLARPHGPPARAIVPDLYFWKSAKWITGIKFVKKDIPGYWETRGYHNHADPWTEERYG